MFNYLLLKNVEDKCKLTNICFADDLLVVAGANTRSFKVLGETLDVFGEMLGLKRNFDKKILVILLGRGNMKEGWALRVYNCGIIIACVFIFGTSIAHKRLYGSNGYVKVFGQWGVRALILGYGGD
ncbi:hypothetical protein LIER_16474 [Lithospermum erythrorhizon]|uniref:Reverse transcriptase domain-containing protein n=1 Tax=Lithospermum erythrorhizon TaxID=34254 RepID=A0AAV3Q6S8_LITER